MRVETLKPENADESPAVAAVGAIHGDEPCGVRAIERFRARGPTDRIQRPVKLIIANERALDAGTRYVEGDLNRLFPGDPDSGIHEERLAYDLRQEVEDCVTLGFHSTVSFDEPFGTLADLTPQKARIMRALPVDRAADFSGLVTGRSVNLPGFVNVEAGSQGSESAAENAYECLLASLRAMDALPAEPDPTPTTHYQVRKTIEKTPGETYRIHVENFDRVPPGTAYATTGTGESLTADSAFWPVLLSADGHNALLGYAANRTGEIGTVAAD
ncbi:MAG: succinylglutamate desuccinylase/aspartoacylase family protein [Halobellus sp.]|uniref:succinylglutamate desuccinylase/aspartoacylase domain-containing protein n=1 Tax=Halobellus sp. TaxID=1979212 RepID=UPI0035D503E0